MMNALVALTLALGDDLNGTWKPVEVELGGVKLPEAVFARGASSRQEDVRRMKTIRGASTS
jgi:hypothetical protein